MEVLTSETCWAVNNEIIKQVTSSWSLFIQPLSLSIVSSSSVYCCNGGKAFTKKHGIYKFSFRQPLYRVVFPFCRHHGGRNGTITIVGTGRRNLCSPHRVPHEIIHTLQHVTTVCVPSNSCRKTAKLPNGATLKWIFYTSALPVSYCGGTQPADGGGLFQLLHEFSELRNKSWTFYLLD